MKTPARVLFLAEYDSGHWQFSAVGETAEQALDAIRLGWIRHRRQTGALDTWAHIQEDVTIEERRLGVPYRDGNAL